MEDREHDRLNALASTFRAFAEVTTDYRGLLDAIVQESSRLIGDGCVVMLAGDDGKRLVPGAAHARDAQATDVLRAALARVPTDTGSGLAIQVARSGEMKLIPHIEPEALAALVQPAFATAVCELGIRSYLSIPLEVRGRRLGALSLYRFAEGSPAFTEDDKVFARSIADLAALAISNAQLFESLQTELVERKRAEDNTKTFVSLIENSTDFIAMASFEGRVLFVNAAGRALCGLAPERDVRELKLTDFHTPDGLKRGDIIRTRGSWQGEGVLRHFGTGELIPTQVSSFVVRDAAGAPMCFATVQHDMRATKRLEDELRQAQKMEALGRLAGGIAHDFNNLLTVILSYCSLVTRKAKNDARVIADIQQIERAGTRAAELTKQLLAFSRQQVLAPKALDLDAALRAMERMIRPLIGEDIELVIRSGSGLGDVLVDAGQIEQVIVNLVVNARDAMPHGGVLTLATERVDLSDQHGPVPPGTWNVLAVSDTGSGMDDETCAHLFEPFFTTKDRGKGTGLGLSTVMGIVKQSGGHVLVDSRLGRGSTFRVYLPFVSKEAVPIAVPRTVTQSTAGTGRILVVEDEAEVRALVRDVLGQAGYEVLDAPDGEAALELAERLDGAIDLLLTDVIMPKLGGRQLAQRFAELRPQTRVLYMSGYTDDKLGHHGVLDPGVELIQKPLTPDALLSRVREMLK